MLSAKTFLKSYGMVGVTVYGSVTMVSIGSMYLGLRTGKADHLITAPLEQIFGGDSDIVQTIKRQLGEAKNSQRQPQSGASTTIESGTDSRTNNGRTSGFNLAREGAYVSIATVLDSVILPVKLAVCLPLAKAVLKRRGR